MDNIVGGYIALKNIVKVDILRGTSSNNYEGTGMQLDGFLYEKIFVDEYENFYPVYNKNKSVIGGFYASFIKSYFEGDERIVSYSETMETLKNLKNIKLTQDPITDTDSFVK